MLQHTLRAYTVGFVRGLLRHAVLNPSRVLLIGECPATQLPALETRLRFYLGAESKLCVAAGALRRELRLRGIKCSSAYAMLPALLFGRIAFLAENTLTKSFDKLSPEKFPLLSWIGKFRESSWRWPLLALALNQPTGWVAPARRGHSVAILGNGPSAIRLFELKKPGTPVIVCNTAVKSARLREYDVVAVCVCDALYFWAPTPYGEAFRAALESLYRFRSFKLVIDAAALPLVAKTCPWFSPKDILPVRIGVQYAVNCDYESSREQAPMNSVLNTLMLPFAATYFKNIELIGFDGKDPEKKDYFWSHSDEFQFPELLSTVKSFDPGFFADNDSVFYESFNARYSSEIEQVAACCRQRERRLKMMHQSFVPALRAIYEQDAIASQHV